MDAPDIHEFIAQRKHLVWYVKDPRALDNDAIVEAVLNYGDWNDVQEMLRILGIKEVARIFFAHAEQPRCNYRPEIAHYFALYFTKYA